MLPDLTPPGLAHHTTPLQAVGLRANTLPEALAAEPLAVLYFLRHLGCAHCQYVVDKLHALAQANPRFPRIIFVHQESLDVGKAFFAKRFPGVAHISDPQRQLYTLFGIRREAHTLSLFTPAATLRFARRLLQGYPNTLFPTADPRTLSGMFLVRAGQVVWAHRARHAGDDAAAVAKLQALG
jgi:hypothetical protein